MIYALDEPKDDLYTTVLQATPVQEWNTLDQLGAPDNIPFPVLQTLNIYYEGWPPESFLLFFEITSSQATWQVGILVVNKYGMCSPGGTYKGFICSHNEKHALFLIILTTANQIT